VPILDNNKRICNWIFLVRGHATSGDRLTSTIPKQELQELSNLAFVLADMGLGQAEQHSTLSVHICNCLYSTVKLPGFSLDSLKVLLRLFKIMGTGFWPS
jgi:hypothetical protein